MARFALGQGYKADGEDRFFHADGSWIGRGNGARFPWERRSAGGEILRHYYPKDHCLEHEPLQLEADLWGCSTRSRTSIRSFSSTPRVIPSK
jgi:hypothetical protein